MLLPTNQLLTPPCAAVRPPTNQPRPSSAGRGLQPSAKHQNPAARPPAAAASEAGARRWGANANASLTPMQTSTRCCRSIESPAAVVSIGAAHSGRVKLMPGALASKAAAMRSSSCSSRLHSSWSRSECSYSTRSRNSALIPWSRSECNYSTGSCNSVLTHRRPRHRHRHRCHRHRRHDDRLLLQPRLVCSCLQDQSQSRRRRRRH